LYLQHGAGEDETGWSRQGRVNFIMDNSIHGSPIGPIFSPVAGAAPKSKQMIVVMDNGYATYKEGSGSEVRDRSERYLPSFDRNDLEAFEAVMIRELIPMIDVTYRTLADRDHRAMAGLSMVGMQTMAIALTHLDTFSYVGTFSGAQFMRPPAKKGDPTAPL
jgi:enterochelin esterase-like enzyme